MHCRLLAILGLCLLSFPAFAADDTSALLKELPASHVVVPLSGDPQELENTKKLVGSVLGKVATEVIFVRAPG